MDQAPSMRWTMDSIDYAAIDVERMRANDDLMCLLCASAFIETGSDLYSSTLVEHYAADEEVQTWLRDQWQHEELQHGRALARYVTQVWPDFDFDAAFKDFIVEYSELCKVEDLEPSRCLEMASRCIVEMGTATLYRAIRENTDEPVLQALTKNIQADEVHHYSYFYKTFRKYQAQHHHGRFRVLRVLLGRLREISNEDGDIALRHVFKYRHPEYLDDAAEFKRASKRIENFVRRNLSTQMALKMVLKPLDLPPRLQTALEPSLVWTISRFTLH